MALGLTKMSLNSRPFWSPVDPRTEGWFFVGNSPALITLLLGYVYIAKVAGPRWMKNRAPFENLKPVIRLYNLAMVIINAFMLQYILRRTYLGGGYSLYCQGIDYEDRSDPAVEVITSLYYYLFIRIFDFMDTMFFVLRKKFEHVSTLHVTHHCLVVFIGWYGARHGLAGQPMLGTSINMFVHVIMYTYYFLASFGNRFEKYLFWKRYLTQLQLLQFVINLIHVVIPVFEPTCFVPYDHTAVVFLPVTFFLAMFSRFYVKTYLKSRCSEAFESALIKDMPNEKRSIANSLEQENKKLH